MFDRSIIRYYVDDIEADISLYLKLLIGEVLPQLLGHPPQVGEGDLAGLVVVEELERLIKTSELSLLCSCLPIRNKIPFSFLLSVKIKRTVLF